MNSDHLGFDEKPSKLVTGSGFMPALLFIVFLLHAGPALAGPAFVEGEWEMTSTMQMPGMQLPPTTSRICLTKENAVPADPQQNKDCRITEQQVTGDTVTWTMVCDGQGGKSTMHGTATYHGSSMESTVHMTTRGMEMTQHTTGKRVGPCGR